MTSLPPTPPSGFTAFAGSQLLAAGPLNTVALAIAAAGRRGDSGPLLAFDDATGAVVDLDTRGSDADILARLPTEPAAAPEPPRGRGRPKLGVVAREVTLLPRHWEWLAAQPGGASVALRKLVDDARRGSVDRMAERQRRERAYRFLAAIAGDYAGFEEACRALFAGDRPRFETQTADWPADVRAHGIALAFGDTRSPAP